VGLKHTLVGRGLCRGPNWQFGNWPKEEGYESLEVCSKNCQKFKGCTAFELTPSEDAKKNKFRCVLYGHHDLELADGLSLQKTRCFRMLAARSAGHAGQPAGKLKKIELIFFSKILCCKVA
jgi:hypothetical protein